MRAPDGRGTVRDATAHFDACGALVVAEDASLLELLASFRGLTAKCVLMPVIAGWSGKPPAEQLADIDTCLAAGRFGDPQALQSLPLLGLPAVVPESEDSGYYDDAWQFRSGRRQRV